MARKLFTSESVTEGHPGKIATYGHFGRSDLDLPGERTDKAELLREPNRGLWNIADRFGHLTL